MTESQQRPTPGLLLLILALLGLNTAQYRGGQEPAERQDVRADTAPAPAPTSAPGRGDRDSTAGESETLKPLFDQYPKRGGRGPPPRKSLRRQAATRIAA